MHRPMRALRSESHLGLSEARSVFGVVDWKRARCGTRCAVGRNARDGGTSPTERARKRMTIVDYASRKDELAVLWTPTC
jgi:hypothetical protein